MAQGTFNVALGRVNELHERVNNSDPTNAALVVVLLKAAEADAALEDYETLDALLTQAGNTEADFTNYARKVLTDTDITASTVNHTTNKRASTIPNQTWTSAGGASNNTLVKRIICYDPDSTGGDDTTLIPLTHADFAATTNGQDLVDNVNPGGYFEAADNS